MRHKYLNKSVTMFQTRTLALLVALNKRIPSDFRRTLTLSGFAKTMTLKIKHVLENEHGGVHSRLLWIFPHPYEFWRSFSQPSFSFSNEHGITIISTHCINNGRLITWIPMIVRIAYVPSELHSHVKLLNVFMVSFHQINTRFLIIKFIFSYNNKI